uniref:Helix-turn-helix domain-containing protein n=1 Tax=Ignavibacterium album TaxID=591197 RepID=A0A7V2ZLE1_9BACT
MKFVNIKKFSEMKKCSRETVYNAAKRGYIEIDRSSGIPVIFLNEKNLSWQPGQNRGRPKKRTIDFS